MTIGQTFVVDSEQMEYSKNRRPQNDQRLVEQIPLFELLDQTGTRTVESFKESRGTR